VALGSLLNATPFSANAWQYHEHVAISLMSYELACAQLEPYSLQSEETTARFRQVCANPRVAICQAHFAALVADYIEENSQASRAGVPRKARKSYFYKSGVLDEEGHPLACQGEPFMASLEDGPTPFATPCAVRAALLSHYLPLVSDAALAESLRKATCNALDPWPVPAGGKHDWSGAKLVNNSLVAFTDWVTLALRNWKHFQPDSADAFRQALKDEDKGATRFDQFIVHAYAMHYLEDSYAAGHVGVPRKAQLHEDRFLRRGLRQDYAHAFHDDMNNSGQFLSSNAADDWFAFGDGQLWKATLYVGMPNTAITTEQFLEGVFAHVGRGDTPDRKLIDGVTRLRQLRSSEKPGWTTLSLPEMHSKPLQLILCGFFDACPKNAIVLGNPSHGDEDGCVRSG
jgi:hypothetical protein